MKALKVGRLRVAEFPVVILRGVGSSDSRPKRAQRADVVDALDRGSPEPAAIAPDINELASHMVEQVLAAAAMQDKQHVLAIGPFRVSIEANVGPKLCP
jgi:hypothetical protein